jgi:ribA/ribD-fused uncharacterized protein
MIKGKYKFFWKSLLSNWSISPFVDPEGNKFVHNEQYMMWRKAKFFGDEYHASIILQTESPAKCKALGRKVTNFDQEAWDNRAKQIVYEGAYLKFSQNPLHLKALLATRGYDLVETSPYDPIWGIGMSMHTPGVEDPENWLGKNWLGEVLTRVREDLFNRNINEEGV